MQVKTVVVKNEVRVYANKELVPISQKELKQALAAIGSNTQSPHANRMLAEQIARRHITYDQSNWTYNQVRQIVLSQGSATSGGDRFVPRQNVYPHFHVGSNFITLSLASNTHIDLIQPNRTARQFFQQLSIAQLSTNSNGQMIQNLIDKLRQLVQAKVTIMEIGENGEQTDISHQIANRSEGCSLI